MYAYEMEADTSADSPEQAPSWDTEFYLETVVFRVGGTLFRLSKKEFNIPGSWFHSRFSTHPSEGANDSHPIMLSVTVTAFRSFLRVLFSQLNSSATEDSWLDVLELAELWSCKEVRSKAIQVLEPGMAKKTLSYRIGIAKKYKQNDWLQQCYLSAIESEEPISKDVLFAAGVDVDTIATLLEIRQSIYGLMCKHISSALSNAPSGSGPQPCNCGLQWAKGECPYLSYTLTAKKYGSVFYDERLGDRYLVEKDSRSAPPETSAASATPVSAAPKLKKKSAQLSKPAPSSGSHRLNGVPIGAAPLPPSPYEQMVQAQVQPSHSLSTQPTFNPHDHLFIQPISASRYDPSPYDEGEAVVLDERASWPEPLDVDEGRPWDPMGEVMMSSRTPSPILLSSPAPPTKPSSTKNWSPSSATQTKVTSAQKTRSAAGSESSRASRSKGNEHSSSRYGATEDAHYATASASESSKRSWGGLGQFVAGAGTKPSRG